MTTLNQDNKKDQRQRVLYDWLFVDYPYVFNSKNPLPLTKGIADTLLERLPENVTKADLKSVLGWYCRRMNYLQALIKHPHRVNLDNEPVEVITDEEKITAQQQIERYDELRKQAEQKEIPVVVKTESVAVDAPKKLTLKIKKEEPTPAAVPPKNSTHVAIAKGLKVTMVLDPASLPNIDSTGMKKVSLTIQIANTDIQVTTEINAKSYRKALSSIEEYGVDGCNVIVQGSMREYGVIDEAGLVVQPKKQANAE